MCYNKTTEHFDNADLEHSINSTPSQSLEADVLETIERIYNRKVATELLMMKDAEERAEETAERDVKVLVKTHNMRREEVMGLVKQDISHRILKARAHYAVGLQMALIQRLNLIKAFTDYECFGKGIEEEELVELVR